MVSDGVKGKFLQLSYYRGVIFLVCLFPLFFVFSFITVPGIGSPEKFLSLCILFGGALVFYFQYKKFYFNKVRI